jgi:hypothetical protein
VAAKLKMPAGLRKTRDATSQALLEDTPEPSKIETIKLEVIEDVMRLKNGVLSTLINKHIGDIKDMLLQTVDHLPSFYRDFSMIHELFANGINMLQTRVKLVSESQKTSRQETLVSMDVSLVDSSFQTTIDSLAAELG